MSPLQDGEFPGEDEEKETEGVLYVHVGPSRLREEVNHVFPRETSKLAEWKI